MDNLEEFLNVSEQPVVENENPQAPETPTAEQSEVTAEAPTGQPRDDKGRFASKGDTPEPPAQVASPATPEPQLDHAALIGERRRRQEAEAEIERLRQQYAQQPQPQQPEHIPDRWEDPEGYDQYLIAQASTLAEQRAIHAINQQRIYQSAVRARSKYEDYDTAHAVFGEMAQRNPSLFDQMLSADDPAEFAYKEAKAEMDIRQHGSIEALIAARVKAELEKAQPTPQTPIPDTLADAQSARGGSATSVAPPTFEEILGRK